MKRKRKKIQSAKYFPCMLIIKRTHLLSFSVPYRDSVLTKLLKNALGGNSKTIMVKFSNINAGWSGVAKVSSNLCHRGVQLILAYSWARPAILVASKGRGGMFFFFCFFTLIPVPLSSLSLSFIAFTISFLLFYGR